MLKNCLLLLCLSCMPLICSEPMQMLQEANKAIEQGEHATTLLDRKKAFNRALSLYVAMEKEGDPSPKLLETIGNTYYQLNEYSLALLYYYRSLKLDPNQESVQTSLRLAEGKLDLEESPLTRTWFKQLIHRLPAMPLQWEFLFWTGLAIFIIFSLCIWLPSPFTYSACRLVTSLASLILLMFVLKFYLTPLEAILIYPSGLYQNASFKDPQLIAQPLSEGVRLEVLETLKEGSWLKVRTSDQTIGYIPLDAIRII